MKPAALLILLMLSACATPASTTQPAHDDVLAGLVASTTQTAVTVAAENAAATEAARVVQADATAAAVSTVDAAFVNVAVNAQEERDRVSLAAFELRLANETRATAEANFIVAKGERTNQERGAWFWDLFAGAVLLVLVYAGIGGGRLLHRNASTVRDKDGNPYIYKDDYLYDNSPSTPLLIEQPARQLPFTTRNGETITVDSYRRAIRLTRADNSRLTVYTFTGQNLDALETNILTNDIGFRRETSGDGYGLNDLIGLSNGGQYSAIVTAMMGRGWLESVGTKNRWTDRGVIEMLEMDGLPHSQNGSGE